MKVLRWYALCLLLLATFSARAQYTTVTATLTGTDSAVWNNAQVQIIFQPAAGYSGSYSWNGGTYRALPTVTTTANSSGMISVAVPSNTSIAPAGTGWYFNVCPQASSPCVTTLPLSVSGGSQSVTAFLAPSLIINPVNPTQLATAYQDSQVAQLPGVGQLYFDSATGSRKAKLWDGSTWNEIAYVGGGGGISPCSVVTDAISCPDGFEMPAEASPRTATAGTVRIVGPTTVATPYTYAPPNAPPAGTQVQGCTNSGGHVSCNWTSLPSGSSAHLLYVSTLGCAHQDTDLTVGGGTDDGPCIQTACQTATATNPVRIIQDGASLIGSIICPATGNWSIEGLGGGIEKVQLLTCSITSNVATFTTAPNTLVAGQKVQLAMMSHCTDLNTGIFTVNSSGLSSTGFTVNATFSNIGSAAESGVGVTVVGTGFYLKNSQADGFATGNYLSAGACTIAQGTIPSRGANWSFSNFVFNGNAANQSTYCFPIHIANMDNGNIDNVVMFNCSHFCTTLDNDGFFSVDKNTSYTTSTISGTNTDGVHIDGPANDFSITNLKCHTGDDCIALNAWEGYCGPITRGAISNVNLDDSYNYLRMYNTSTTCPNGSNPLISKIDSVNASGSVHHAVTVGLGSGTLGSNYPAVKEINISNSTFKMEEVSSPILIGDNTGSITFSNLTIESPQANSIISLGHNVTLGSAVIGTINIHNLTVLRNAAGNQFEELMDFGDANTVDAITVDGVNDIWEDSNSYTPVQVLMSNGGASLSNSPAVNTGMVSNVNSEHILGVWGNSGGHNISNLYPSIYGHIGQMDNNFSISAYQALTGTDPSSVYPVMYSGNVVTSGTVTAASNCNSTAIISPFVCWKISINGSDHYIPVF